MTRATFIVRNQRNLALVTHQGRRGWGFFRGDEMLVFALTLRECVTEAMKSNGITETVSQVAP